MSRETKRRVWSAVIVICAVAILWNGYSVYKTFRGYRHGDDDLQKIYQMMENVSAAGGAGTAGGSGSGSAGAADGGAGSSDSADGSGALSEADAARLAGYQLLHETNSDVIGWVRIEDTNVDYPVMQTVEEPDFYLHRGFDKEYSSYGMIYMDARCSLDKECPNYVLYGHHMRNGSMFAQLDEYKSEEFFRAHPVVHFDTLTELRSYEIVGVVRIPAASIDNEFLTMMGARTEDTYSALIDYVRENGYYDTGITPQWPEQLVTLTTCEYTVQDGRLLVLARRIPAPAAS